MMETQITLLTREMLTDYRTFSGKCIESPEDYMIFRRQAIKELGLDIEKEPETVKTEKKPKAPAESKKEKPVKQTKPVQMNSRRRKINRQSHHQQGISLTL